MSKKRNEYIDQLLNDLELLEERLLSVKESDTLPFSFFSASFDRIEKISRSLHELELLQIGEMKEQMERLVRFLSEQPKHSDSPAPPPAGTEEVVIGQGKAVAQEREKQQEEITLQEEAVYQERVAGQGETAQQHGIAQPEGVMEQERAIGRNKAGVTGRIVLPEYRDPRRNEAAPPPAEARKTLPVENGQEKPAARSLNDIIQAPPALLDLKRGISLNDRFLFQRELFNNNRDGMNSVMERLNTLGSFEEVENYLRSEQNWNFENQTVKEFLLVIKKGFE